MLMGEASSAITTSPAAGAPTSGTSTTFMTSAGLPNASTWIAFMTVVSSFCTSWYITRRPVSRKQFHRLGEGGVHLGCVRDVLCQHHQPEIDSHDRVGGGG